MNFAPDKIIHFLVGYVLAVHGAFALMFLKVPLIGCLIGGLLIGTIAAVAKEIYDKRHPEKHTADRADAFATIYGSAAGIFVTIVVAFIGFRL